MRKRRCSEVEDHTGGEWQGVAREVRGVGLQQLGRPVTLMLVEPGSPSVVPIGAAPPDGSVSIHRWKDSPEPKSSHRNCCLQRKRESPSSCLVTEHRPLLGLYRMGINANSTPFPSTDMWRCSSTYIW